MSDPNAILMEAIRACAAKLKPLGFRPSGRSLKFLKGENLALIEFQKSQTSNKSNLKFTVNLAVVNRRLLEEHEPKLESATSANAHLRLRLGLLLPPKHRDFWWEVTASTSAEHLIAEIVHAVSHYGLPYLCANMTDEKLIELWSSGKSPGLTEFEREAYLKKLKSQLDLL